MNELHDSYQSFQIDQPSFQKAISLGPVGIDAFQAGQVCNQFQMGLKHQTSAVRNQFRKSLEAARKACQENASETLVTAALLCFPCHMLASRLFTSIPWNSDSIIESGTLDWLNENFGELVAEVIRLQPHCLRYHASINEEYARDLDPTQVEQFLRDGAEMSVESKLAFARGRHFSPAMQLSRWIHQVNGRETPRIDQLDIPWSKSSLTCNASWIN